MIPILQISKSGMFDRSGSVPAVQSRCVVPGNLLRTALDELIDDLGRTELRPGVTHKVLLLRIL